MTGGPLLTRRLLSSIALMGAAVPAVAQHDDAEREYAYARH